MSGSFYKIVYQNGTGEIVEKKSRFIANVYKVETEDEVSSYINAAKKKYWDARHNCYAFVIGENNEIQRSSDDGEPSGTAGKPIMEVLMGNEVHNCLIIVTRYFGGTLLGTGGLIRAYQQAAKVGLENSTIIEKQAGTRLRLTTDYNGLGKIQHIAEQKGFYIAETEYTDVVAITMVIPDEYTQDFADKVTEITAGKALIENQGKQYFAYENGRAILF